MIRGSGPIGRSFQHAMGVLAIACLVLPAHAQTDPKVPITVVIRAAAEPRPALKYRLQATSRDQIRGNAALFYHRAIQEVMQVDNSQRASAVQSGEKAQLDPENSPPMRVSRWAMAPASELPLDEARAQMQRYAKAITEVELGAKRTYCDWELDQRTEGFSLLIPEIQESRTLARIIAVQARLAIREGKLDEAFHWIQVGMTLGRHVASGPFLIQALVGIAIDSQMQSCLLDLIQTPGSPSLYWALADRYRPFIDPRPALEGERFGLEKELPELADLESHVWSLDEARAFSEKAVNRISALTSGSPPPLKAGGSVMGRLGVAAMAAKIYPEAKQYLLEQGWSADQINAMPIFQVSALYTVRQYQALRDDMYKWMYIPYYESYNKIDAPIIAMKGDVQANPILTLFSLLMPAINSGRFAFVRLERSFDALQVIEAIRLYAHDHKGRLPESLGEIRDFPLPIDPATGQPFAYQREGESAILRAPTAPGMPDHPSFQISYKLVPAP